MKNQVRLHIVQALYQREIAHTSLEQLRADYAHWQKHSIKPERAHHFEQMLDHVVRDEKELDQKIQSLLPSDWRLDRLEKILLVLLRAGIAEKESDKMLADYVQIAHKLLDKKSAAMANAILDKIVHAG